MLCLMLLKRFSSASSTIWVTEGLSVESRSPIYYIGLLGRVQILPTAATQKTFKALPVRCSVYFCMTLTQAAVDVVKSNMTSYTEMLNVKLF